MPVRQILSMSSMLTHSILCAKIMFFIQYSDMFSVFLCFLHINVLLFLIQNISSSLSAASISSAFIALLACENVNPRPTAKRMSFCDTS